jgi:hypothetical protein
MATNLRGAYKQTELLGANGDFIRPRRDHDEQIAQQKGAKFRRHFAQTQTGC